MPWVSKRTIGGVGERRGGGERGPEHHRGEKMARRGHPDPLRAPQIRAGSGEAPPESSEPSTDQRILPRRVADVPEA
jgi:hypothetical protein